MVAQIEQAKREERAQAQAGQYRIRLVTIAGTLAAYVISPGGVVYTVNNRRECNCPDHQQRCKGTALRCKHVLMVDRHIEQLGSDWPDPEAGERERRHQQSLRDRALWD